MVKLANEIEALLSLLRTDDPPVQRDVKLRVVEKLRTKDKQAVTAALCEAVRDVEADYRCTAAWVFLVFDFEVALPYVRSLLLEDVDGGVRGYLCQILGASTRREAAPLLLEVLFNDSEGTHRVIAAWGLGNIGDPSALPALRTAMQNDDGVDYEGRPVKEIAAEAIRRITQERTATSVA